MTKYAQVILPLAVKSDFTYQIPEMLEGQIMVGCRVVVPFGNQKLYTGLVKLISSEPQAEVSSVKIKSIESVLDAAPVVTEKQLELWAWMASYYVCAEGEIMLTALPGGLKPQSAIWVYPGDVLPAPEEVKNKEWYILQTLESQARISIPQASELMQVKNPLLPLKQMEAKGWIRLEYEMGVPYKVKTRTVWGLTESLQSDAELSKVLTSLTKFPKQEAALLHIIAAGYQGKKLSTRELKDQHQVSASALQTLVKKFIIQAEEEVIDRTQKLAGFRKRGEGEQLFDWQQQALHLINQYFSEIPLKPTLLEGITGSGKTLIYLELIRQKIQEGLQVLYLLPEINLTPQVINRLRTAFGDKVGIYHSRFSEQERVEIWHKVLTGAYEVVVGVRSAIFLPFEQLGLIIVDEEHDSSFRQSEKVPYYHARNLALWYGNHWKVPVLLGTATPAVETAWAAKEGKFHSVQLNRRALDAIPPTIDIIDLNHQHKFKLSNGIFSDRMEAAIQAALDKKEQVILFQNRRGYAPYQICRKCGHIPQCIYCDISLTLHKQAKELKCHYCGYGHQVSLRCEQCGALEVETEGIGTEKIEEEIHRVFPTARVDRMDQDSVKSRSAAERLIEKMELGETDILVGTQMVAKGLDFEKVSLVGVLLADPLLFYPDFRSREHAMQLLSQVAGRAGRRRIQGQVMIQTRQPHHPVFTWLKDGDYKGFLEEEWKVRQELSYPPFCRLIRLELRHKDAVRLGNSAKALEHILRKIFDRSVLGPEPPPISRVRSEFRLQFLIKISNKASPDGVRKQLLTGLENWYKHTEYGNVRVWIEVDP